MKKGFSHRQFLFAEYLLRKIGFQESKKLKIYLDNLEKIYGRHYKEEKRHTAKNGYVSYSWKNRYTNSECIEQLIKEVKLKKNLGEIKLKNLSNNHKVSATDLSNFNFCPVSYSIGKTFEIEYPTNEDKRIIGVNLHEKLRLLNKKAPKNFTDSDFIEGHIVDDEKIKKIKNCDLIFSGHTEEKKFFQNQQMNFVGQPDYIFKDPKGKYFVVEEKFKYFNTYMGYDNLKGNSFYSNHIVQLQSYINYIEDYKIDYGILIYWFYDFINESPRIHKYAMKVVKADGSKKLLEKTFLDLTDFIKNKKMRFENQANLNKCSACVVNKYCAHKTDTLNEIKLPYNRYDMKLKYMDFPEELKTSANTV